MSDKPKWDASDDPSPSRSVEQTHQTTATVIPMIASQYLAQRDVTTNDIARYKIEFITPDLAADLLGLDKNNRHRRAVCAIWLPGWRADGSINPGYGHAVFFFKNPWDNKVVRSRPSPTREKHAQDLVFMPPVNGKSWKEQTSKSIVVICESWIKALVVSKLGYLAVAMNGVYGWSTGGGQLAGNVCAGFLDPIWRDRAFKVTILTDSFNTQKPASRRNVAQAKTWLASHLVNKGVVARDAIWLAEMPANPHGGDWGIDDLTMDPKFGPAAARNVIDAPTHTTLHEPVEMMLQGMNDSYCWVRSLGKAFELSTGELYAKGQLFDSLANVRYAYVDGNNKSKVSEIAKAWMTSEGRNSASTMKFLPGQPQKMTTTDPYTGQDVTGLNLWRGFLVEPWTSPIDVDAAVGRVEQYFCDTLRGMFGDEYAAYLIKLLAHAIQHPEARYAVFVYIWGNGGTGKNFLSTALRLLYGPIHFVAFTMEGYGNKFNSSKRSAAWAFLNEVPSSLPRDLAVTIASEIKEDADPNIVTRELEPKGVDKKTVDRNCKVLAASQFPPPFAVDDGLRRRMFLLRTADAMAKHDPLSSKWGTKDHAWWADRWDWLTSDVGARDLITHLGRASTVGFKPTDDALQTTWLVKLLQGQGTRTFPEFVLSMKRDLRAVLEEAGMADELGPVALDEVRYFNATMAVALYRKFNADSSVGVKTAGVDMAAQDLPQRKISLPPRAGAKARTGFFYDLRPGAVEPSPAEAFALIDKTLKLLVDLSAKWTA